MIALLATVHLLTCEPMFVHMSKDSEDWQLYANTVAMERALRCETPTEICFYFHNILTAQRAVTCVKK